MVSCLVKNLSIPPGMQRAVVTCKEEFSSSFFQDEDGECGGLNIGEKFLNGKKDKLENTEEV